jgi:signal peptidase I
MPARAIGRTEVRHHLRYCEDHVSDPLISSAPVDTPPPPLGDAPPAVAEPPAGRPSKRRNRSNLRNIIEWVAIIAAALVVAIVIKTFLFQAFYIPSESMEPTLKPNDRVLVNKLSYKLHAIHRGDIVVFKRPPSEASDPTIKDLIKRVIGLPGDTIEGRNDEVYINGQPLKETYVMPGAAGLTANFPATKVGNDQYFVMGDNRTNSKDSRFIGTIPKSLVVGRAFIRVWPLSKIRLF